MTGFLGYFVGSSIYATGMIVTTVVLGATRPFRPEPWQSKSDEAWQSGLAVCGWPITAFIYAWVGLWHLGGIVRGRLERKETSRLAFSVSRIAIETKKASAYRDGRILCHICLPADACLISDRVLHIGDVNVKVVEIDGTLRKQEDIDTSELLRRIIQGTVEESSGPRRIPEAEAKEDRQ